MSTGEASDSIALFTDSSDRTSTPAMTCPPSASRSAEDDRTNETRLAPMWKTRWLRPRPASALGASFSARLCFRLPRASASLGQFRPRWPAISALFFHWGEAEAAVGAGEQHALALEVRAVVHALDVQVAIVALLLRALEARNLVGNREDPFLDRLGANAARATNGFRTRARTDQQGARAARHHERRQQHRPTVHERRVTILALGKRSLYSSFSDQRSGGHGAFQA
eukprot:scaffold46366_cov37-Phaeocystis_antarctica.AAC.1